MRNPMQTGTLIALTAASLFAAACSKKDEGTKSAPTDKAAPSAEKTSKVHCEGVNACKGQGGCKSENNACKGQNGCKGQGFTETATAEDCTARGGKVAAAKM